MGAYQFVWNGRRNFLETVDEMFSINPVVITAKYIFWSEDKLVTIYPGKPVSATIPGFRFIIESSLIHSYATHIFVDKVIFREAFGIFQQIIFDEISGKITDVISTYSIAN